MILAANGLKLELSFLRKVDEEDWTRVGVSVKDAGFRGDFEAWLQSEDVERFANEIAQLIASVGIVGKAALGCVEPGISLEIEMNNRGQIHGRYEFSREGSQGFHPTLAGIIDMDQSYLPLWEGELRSFLSRLRGIDVA